MIGACLDEIARILRPTEIQKGNITSIKNISFHFARIGVRWPGEESALSTFVTFDSKGFIIPTKECRELYKANYSKDGS